MAHKAKNVAAKEKVNSVVLILVERREKELGVLSRTTTESMFRVQVMLLHQAQVQKETV